MATIESYPPRTTLKQRQPGRPWHRFLAKPVVPVPHFDSAETGREATYDRRLLVRVTLLNLPSLIFVLFYAIWMPEDVFLNVGSTEALTVLGLFSASLTFGAFLTTMAALLRGEISAKTARTLWAVMTLTLLGWLYVWISFSIMFHVPPLVFSSLI
jgi:hypothetical protein